MKTTMMILGSILLGSACGGSDDLTAGELSGTILSLYCDKAYGECGDQQPAGYQDFYGATAAECETILAAFLGTEADVNASVAAGRIDFDAAQGAACIDDSTAQIDAISCADFFAGNLTDDASCDAALQGTVAAGGTCYTSIDCVEDTTCTFANGADTGTCEAPQA